MNLKRGILIGIALYIAEIIVMLAAIYIIFSVFAESKSISSIYALTTFIITVILTSLAGLWYFNKAKRDTKEGLKLGLIFVVISIILEIVASLITKEGFKDIINTYKSVYFYISFIIIIATTIFIGSRNKTAKEKVLKKHKKK